MAARAFITGLAVSGLNLGRAAGWIFFQRRAGCFRPLLLIFIHRGP